MPLHVASVVCVLALGLLQTVAGFGASTHTPKAVPIYVGHLTDPHHHPYVHETRAAAEQACKVKSYKGLCTKKQGTGFSRCAAGWYKDYKGYWMSHTARGCGRKGWNSWGRGPVGAYCCGKAGSGSVSGCGNYSTPSNQKYQMTDIVLGPSKAITFSVQAKNDAHVGFFSSKKSNKEVYEICISGWGNRQSVIRESNQGQNKVTKATPALLNGKSRKYFWADAVKGLVRLGAGNAVGANIIMSWKDPTPHVVQHVGLMTGWGSPGKWEVCASGRPLRTCVFARGDGIGGSEKYLRQTSSQTECVAAAVASSAKANGATWGPGNKKCYAEFGETGHDNSAAWTTCVFATVLTGTPCGCEQDGLKFCNFDYGSRGKCELCKSFPAKAKCFTDGLPAKGAADCATRCFAKQMARPARSCVFARGDGTGGSEKYLKQTVSSAACAAAVEASSAKANGATWGPGNKKCYAEFGETGHDNSASWTTCVFGATASKPCYRSVPAPNTVVGKHLSGSGTTKWRSLDKCIQIAAAHGQTNMLRYVQNANGRCYYYASGSSSGRAGSHNWLIKPCSGVPSQCTDHEAKMQQLVHGTTCKGAKVLGLCEKEKHMASLFCAKTCGVCHSIHGGGH